MKGEFSIMKTIHESRIARTARFIAARFENENEVILSIPSDYADSRIFRIMIYMNRYCGKYWIEYKNKTTAIIRKQE